jgi:hypothetical protein
VRKIGGGADLPLFCKGTKENLKRRRDIYRQKSEVYTGIKLRTEV